MGQAVKTATKNPQNKIVIPAKAGTQSNVSSSWVPDQVRDVKDGEQSNPRRHSGAGRNQLYENGKLSPTVYSGFRRDEVKEKREDAPKVTDDEFAENQRAARYIASRDDIGEFSKFVAEGIETDGDKAIAETVDLYHQTAELNQKPADALIDKILPGLSPDFAEP